MFRLFTSKRIFSAIFIVTLVSLALFYQGDRASSKINQATPALAPITVTKNNPTLSTDTNGNGVVNPGDTLTYTVTVSNGATDATGVIFTDVLDSNLTLVPGSVNSSPIAVNESYNVLGNVSISVPLANGVKANDLDPDGTIPTITGFGNSLANANATIPGTATTTAQGGNVTLNPDGSFTYNPPAGYEGADSFFYTLSDGTANDTAQVTLNISGMIWFVKNDAASCTTLAAGCGRLSSPFSSLSSFASINNGTGNNPATGDNIFIYTGSGNYDANLTLLNNQKLIGQGASASLQVISGVTVPSFSATLPATGGTNPTLISTTGNAVNVGSGNTIRGLTIGNTTGSKLNASASVGTLTVGPTTGTSDVALNGTGRALNLTGGGTLAVRFASVSANGGTNGIVLTGMGGNLDSPTTTIQNSTGTGVSVSNSVSGGTFNFGNMTVSGTAGTGVLLSGNANSLTFSALNLTPNSGQRGFHATNNTGTITTTSGTISTTNGVAVEIVGTSAANRTPLNIQLTTVNADGGVNGIKLTNTSATGSPGGFRVLGNTSGNCGGTTVSGNPTTIGIAANSADCSGGRIRNTTAAANQTHDGSGVSLTDADAVHLTRMWIHNHANYGVRGTNGSGFSLTNSIVESNGNNGGGMFPESGLQFTNLGGTASITNSTIRLNFAHNIKVDNQNSTLNLTITGCSIRETNASSNGDDGISLETELTANMTANISSNVFALHGGEHCNWSLLNNAVGNLIFNNNTGTGGHASGIAQGGLFVLGGTVPANITFNYSVLNNNFSGNQEGGLIHVNKGAGNAVFSGTISGNILNGSASSSGIRVESRGTGSHTALVTNNTITNVNNIGILFEAGEGSAAINGTATGNNISMPGANALHGLYANVGVISGDTNQACMDWRNNNLTNAANESNGGSDIRLRQRFSTQIRLPGYTGAGDGSGIPAFMTGTNANAATTITPSSVSSNFTGGAACTQPSFVNAIEFKDDTIAEVRTDDIPAEETAKTENGVKVPSPNYWAVAQGFLADVKIGLGDLVGKLGSIIVPSVQAQAKRSFAPEAGETVCVDGNTDPNNCTGGFTLPANETTTITFRATVNSNSTAVSIPNTANVTANGGINQNSNTVSTTVVQPPLVAKDFVATFISVGGATNLNFTITNPNSTPLTGVSLTDVLPSGLSVANSTTSVCGGTNNLVVTAATRTIQLTGATVPANNGTCTFSVTVTGASEGSQVNVTGNVNSTQGGQGGTATDTVTVINPPTLAKTFTPNQIQLNGTSTLQFTLSNPNTTLALNTLAFTDSLPSGVTAPNTGATTVCSDGSYSISSNVISFTKPSLAAGTNCVFSITVTGTSAGLKTNITSTVTTSNSDSGTAATANLTVVASPTITKAFNPSMILVGGTSTVTLTLSNPNTTGDLTNASFTDNLTNMSAVGGAVGGTCAGTTPNTLSPGATNLSFSGITIPNNSNCTVTFDVTSNTVGTHPNTTSGVTTTQTPTAGAASNTVNLSVGNTVTWTGATNTNWNTATNWNPASVPVSSNNVLIPSIGVTNEPSILTAEPDVTVNALEIQPGRTLTINSGRTLTVTNALTNNGTINNAGSFSFGTLNAGGTVNFTGTTQQTIPAGIYNDITINNAAGVVLAGDVTVNNVLTLTNGSITTNADTFIIGANGSISRTSGYVIGNLRKDFPVPFNFNEAAALPPVFVYPVGTANGYSPATIDIVSGSGSFTVSATQNFLPGVNQTQSIQRYWSLTSNGITEANITFQYLDADVPMGATEANFNFIRRTGMTNMGFAPSSLDTTTNTFTLNGVTQFSDWTIGNLAPTAAAVSVSGRVITAEGRGIRNAILTLTDQYGNVRQARSSSFGYYRFFDVMAGETYVLAIRSKRYTFPQPAIVVSVTDELTDVNFVADP